MYIVILTAVGVGGATVIGALIGFLFKRITESFSEIIMSFAAGVMLSAAILGLILPSLNETNRYSIYITLLGIFVGVFSMKAVGFIIPHINKIGEIPPCDLPLKCKNDRKDKALILLLAIAIHNFPEGIAAGVGFGTDEPASAFLIAGSIALQNIPEGMIVVAPMLNAGVSKRCTFCYAAMTGLIEVLGTFVGYFAISIASLILPFALSFAGGTMLYVVSDEIMPQTYKNNVGFSATFSLILGFCLMLFMDFIL